MKTVEEIIGMKDDELRAWTLSGDAGSYDHQIGQTEMNMRCALRIAEAAQQMATVNQDLVRATTQLVSTTNQVVGAHHGLIRETRGLVRATWGIVVITLATQIALIVSEFLRK